MGTKLKGESKRFFIKTHGFGFAMEDQGCWTCLSTNKMVLFALLVLSNLVASTNAEEQLLIIHKPDYLNFHENSNLRASEIPDILSSIFGFTTLNDDKWTGVDSGHPFKRPEGIVMVEVEGLRNTQLKTSGLRFPLTTDVEPGWPFQLISDRIYIRFADEKPVLMSIANDDSLYSLQSEYPTILNSLAVKPNELKAKVLGSDSVVAGIDLKALNKSLVPDMKFLMDAQLLVEIANIAKSKATLLRNGIPDLFWFHLTGIQELVFVYGYKSDQVEEAVNILNRALAKLKETFIDVYNSNAVITVLAVDYQTGNSVRAGRSLLQAAPGKPPDENTYNVAVAYDETYSAIFNITLFIMLVFWLSIFAISLGIWHMDPGRDSIIYRMTSQRMKKDQ